jgi:hypothetical protein
LYKLVNFGFAPITDEKKRKIPYATFSSGNWSFRISSKKLLRLPSQLIGRSNMLEKSMFALSSVFTLLVFYQIEALAAEAEQPIVGGTIALFCTNDRSGSSSGWAYETGVGVMRQSLVLRYSPSLASRPFSQSFDPPTFGQGGSFPSTSIQQSVRLSGTISHIHRDGGTPERTSTVDLSVLCTTPAR